MSNTGICREFKNINTLVCKSLQNSCKQFRNNSQEQKVFRWALAGNCNSWELFQEFQFLVGIIVPGIFLGIFLGMFLGTNSHSLLVLQGTLIPKNNWNVPRNKVKTGILISIISGIFLECSWNVLSNGSCFVPGNIIPDNSQEHRNCFKKNCSWNIPCLPRNYSKYSWELFQNCSYNSDILSIQCRVLWYLISGFRKHLEAYVNARLLMKLHKTIQYTSATNKIISIRTQIDLATCCSINLKRGVDVPNHQKKLQEK